MHDFHYGARRGVPADKSARLDALCAAMGKPLAFKCCILRLAYFWWFYDSFKMFSTFDYIYCATFLVAFRLLNRLLVAKMLFVSAAAISTTTAAEREPECWLFLFSNILETFPKTVASFFQPKLFSWFFVRMFGRPPLRSLLSRVNYEVSERLRCL